MNEYIVQATVNGVGDITDLRISADSKADAVIFAINNFDVVYVYSVWRVKDD